MSEAEWQQYLADRNARKKTTPIPEFIQVAGTGKELADSIEKRLSIDVGKPVDTTKMDAQMMRLQGQGRFANVGYSMVEKDGNPGAADSNRAEAIRASHGASHSSHRRF